MQSGEKRLPFANVPYGLVFFALLSAFTSLSQSVRASHQCDEGLT